MLQISSSASTTDISSEPRIELRTHNVQRHFRAERSAHRGSILLALVAFCLLVSRAFAAPSLTDTVRFRSPHGSLIVVDVLVNGRGPYEFMLDTGATSSSVDEELAEALHLAPAQGVRLATWTDTREIRRVLVQDLTLGPVNSGPLQVLVQPLLEFRALGTHVHGVLGQDMLLALNYLIDNGAHRIEFDMDGSLLSGLAGDRVNTASVNTKAGPADARLRSIPVHTDLAAAPLQLILDSGAEMVILQPRFKVPGTLPRGNQWIANDDGKLSRAATLPATLSVGSEKFSTEAWIGDQGLDYLIVDGLLPTSNFRKLYISNTGSFVIIEPRHLSRRRY